MLVLLFALPAAGLCFAEGEGFTMNASGVPNRVPSVDPTGKTEGFSAVLYNNPNGLPTSEANAIAETDEGFIWIGSACMWTAGGVCGSAPTMRASL